MQAEPEPPRNKQREPAIGKWEDDGGSWLRDCQSTKEDRIAEAPMSPTESDNH